MIKLKDINDLNIKKFVGLAFSKTRNLEIAEDLFAKAYTELLSCNKVYNDKKHAEYALSQRIISRNKNMRKVELTAIKHQNDVIKVLYKKTNPIVAWQNNYDANKILDHILNTKSTLRAKIFIKALDDSSYGATAELSKELGISKENYKTTLLSVRKLVKEFYY